MKTIKTTSDKQKALKILVNAYFEAANVTWMLKKKSRKNLYTIFNLLFHEAKSKNGAYLSENETCVLFLYKQKEKYFSWIQIFRKLYIFLFVTGFAKGLQAIKFQKLVSAIRPHGGLLGMALAIDEKPMTTATIFELKKSVFDLSKSENLPIYAETTVPRLLKLYQVLGFQVYHEMKHPYAELDVWFLKRDLEID
jgi:hypothetical protein